MCLQQNGNSEIFSLPQLYWPQKLRNLELCDKYYDDCAVVHIGVCSGVFLKKLLLAPSLFVSLPNLVT